MKEFFSYLQSTYPKSRPQDIVKALYQSFCGAGHAVDLLSAQKTIVEECALCNGPGRVEKLLGKYERYHLGRETEFRQRAIAALFFDGAGKEDREGFLESLKNFSAFPFTVFTREEKDNFLNSYLERGLPLLSHSEEYRNAYAPHYRVLPETHVKLIDVLAEIYLRKDISVICLDGRCGSGKTTYADILGRVLGAQVIHCDDFFIPKEQRTAPHEINLDIDRFVEEVAVPLSEGKNPRYRKYDCRTDRLLESGYHPPAPYYIVEGSYSTAPQLGKYYDFSVFCDVNKVEQKNRLLRREGEIGYIAFREKWIPSEEEYFSRYDISDKCDKKIF